MSEPILMALVQLFAIVAASLKKEVSSSSRNILESYLGQHLRNTELEEYLKLFDELVLFHTPDEDDPSGEAMDVSDQIRALCLKTSRQLGTRDRFIVFIKFVEFLDETAHEMALPTTKEWVWMEKYIQVFRETFSLPESDFNNGLHFILNPFGPEIRKENLLVVGPNLPPEVSASGHLLREQLAGHLLFLQVPAIRTYLFRYLGSDTLYLNGHTVTPFKSFLFLNGSIINGLKVSPIYFADVAKEFIETREMVPIDFTASEIGYRFRNSANGIQPFSFTASSGELIGVMGGSGVGKSTLLNILNGTMEPMQGEVLINGYPLSGSTEALQGVIGFVPQDDLLIEELTVFQNLYYNAKLCFKEFSESQLIRAVMRVLMDIDLNGIRNLTVGDPLNKFISGGQRKRLNIALELIREPSVLFADEPTSGLSSMDSEMVMLLLKEQTLKGRLVVVNIHQPSSDIFKLFDKLLIMDKGGYPIYYGNPIDALAYFKTATSHVNPGESECQACGYVNPEQLLQITESRILNEYGKQTNTRKITPAEWYALFRKTIQPGLPLRKEQKPLPKNSFKVPGMFRQFRIFSTRNLLSKITNRQYLLINLLEAPLLAALLAFLTRYRHGSEYLFGDNRNLVPYLFMSVVVSLFLGMMVSAEEIIRDRKLLKREAFLNLSRFSYLNSKIVLLFTLSAIQTLLYVITGNMILGIKGMTASYWLILFATSCFANMVGLNLSAGMNSVVAIYILIPFILVPQLLLSGTIVPYDQLNPAISSRNNVVPVVGDVMASRWTFEALAVEQFSKNDYEKIFYPYDKQISRYAYITSYLIPTLQSELDQCRYNTVRHENNLQTNTLLAILRNEIPPLLKEAGFRRSSNRGLDKSLPFDTSFIEPATSLLDSLSRHFSAKLSQVTARRDARYEKLERELGAEGLQKFKKACYNENLADLVMNKNGEYRIIQGNGKLIRKKDPVFMDPENSFGRAHFYAPVKQLGSWQIDTLWFNFAAIWLMSLLLYAALLGDWLRRGVNMFGKR